MQQVLEAVPTSRLGAPNNHANQRDSHDSGSVRPPAPAMLRMLSLCPVPRSQSPLRMPTTCGDIQQKNRQLIFDGVETSMKMTFHSPAENQRATRRRRLPLSNTPLLFFH